MQEFSDSNEHLFCPFPSAHKRSSSSPSSSLSIYAAHDKKQYEKQATRNRIGQAFRKSWARKDTDHKASKMCNSLVTTSSFG
jgi:stromal membrane-associated protein